MRRITIRQALAVAVCGIAALCYSYPVLFCLNMTVRYAIVYTFDEGRWSYYSNAEVLEGADKHTFWVVERSTGKVLGQFAGEHGGAAYCPVANTLSVTYFGDSGHGTKVVDVISGEVLMAVQHWGGPLAMSPDGRTLATAGPLGDDVRLWDTSTGQERVCEDNDDWQGCHGGWSDYCHFVTFSSDGSMLATCNDGRIAFWDVASGKNIWLTRPATVLISLALLSLAVYGIGLAASPWLRSRNLTQVFVKAFLLLQALEMAACFFAFARADNFNQEHLVLAASLIFFVLCLLGFALLWSSKCATRQAGLALRATPASSAVATPPDARPGVSASVPARHADTRTSRSPNTCTSP
jgi:hypothetical protein